MQECGQALARARTGATVYVTAHTKHDRCPMVFIRTTVLLISCWVIVSLLYPVFAVLLDHPLLAAHGAVLASLLALTPACFHRLAIACFPVHDPGLILTMLLLLCY